MAEAWREKLIADLKLSGQKNMGLDRDPALENIGNNIADAIVASGGGGGDSGWRDALNKETDERKAADSNLKSAIGELKEESESAIGNLGRQINEETTRAKESEKANADAIESLSGSIDAHVSDKSNPHEVTAEQIGAAKSTDLAAYVKKAGDTMTGRLTVQTAGGDPAKAAEGAMVAKMTAAANKTGFSTNGSVFAGDLDNTNSQFVGSRRKLFTGDKVAARFQIYASNPTAAASQGCAAFMQVDYTSKATVKSIFEFGHNYGTKEDNWGTMTFGDVTKNVAYKEDFDPALNDTSESAPQTKAVKAAIDSHDEKIKAVTDLIPTAATPANQLADKAYVDFGVEQMAAKYLSATADGQPFSSYAQFQQGVFYYAGDVTEPTKNDYALVNGDETHDNAVTRYVFTTEWNFQYVVNNSPLNAEQLAALNSTINAFKVGNYDSHIADTTKHITDAERTKWNGYETGKANATHTHAASQVSGLAAVATTGSYNDLTGKPTIPPAITVDSAMSSTSTNPVQNKVVNTELDKKVNRIVIEQPSEYKSFLILEDITRWVDKTSAGALYTYYQMIGQLNYWRSDCGYDSISTMFIKFHLNYQWDLGNKSCFEMQSTEPAGSCRPCILKDERDTSSIKYYFGLIPPALWKTTFEFIGRVREIDVTKISWLEGKTATSKSFPDGVSIFKDCDTMGWTVSKSDKFTPRSLGVNLARTAASTFDGSANQLEIPVKGKLPDDNIASASTWNNKQDALSFTTSEEVNEILGGLE